MTNGLIDYAKKNSGIVLALLLAVEAIHLRIYFFRNITPDFTVYVNPWIQFIREHGFWNAFQYNFSNYPPLYLHMLAILSLFIKSNLFVVKAVSWIFEIIALIYVYKILTHFNIEKQRKWILTSLFLLLPTVLLNGSYWGQCDIVYGSLVLASLYYLLKKKFFHSYLFLGIAFALKLQTIFILPLYFLSFLLDKKTWKYALLVPAMYFLTVLPSFIAGRSLSDLVTIYVSQANPEDPIVQNATNVYMLFPNPEKYHELLSKGGVWFTGILVLVLCITLYMKHRHSGLSNELILTIALLFTLVLPYFMPHMHDRYFILADMLSFLFVVVTRKHYFIPVIIIYGSLQSYLAYLRGFVIIAPSHISFLYLVVLIFIAILAYRNAPSVEENTIRS